MKKIKMGKIGHSSALRGRELAHFLTRPVTIATPVNKSTPDGRSAGSSRRDWASLGLFTAVAMVTGLVRKRANSLPHRAELWPILHILIFLIIIILFIFTEFVFYYYKKQNKKLGVASTPVTPVIPYTSFCTAFNGTTKCECVGA